MTLSRVLGGSSAPRRGRRPRPGRVLARNRLHMSGAGLAAGWWVAMLLVPGCQLDRTPKGPGSDVAPSVDPPPLPGPADPGPPDGGAELDPPGEAPAVEAGMQPAPVSMEPKKPSGAMCGVGWECESGYCARGLCCAGGQCCTDDAMCQRPGAGSSDIICYEFSCCRPRVVCMPGECGSEVDDGCGGTIACGGCDDGNPCTDDVCMEGACVPVNNTAPCDDGVYCNGSDTCSDGRCVHAGDPCPPPDGDGDCREACSEADQTCTANDPSGSPCDDGLECTADDACTGGRCRGRTDNASCDDGNRCTIDRCDVETGCVSVDNGLCE